MKSKVRFAVVTMGILVHSFGSAEADILIEKENGPWRVGTVIEAAQTYEFTSPEGQKNFISKMIVEQVIRDNSNPYVNFNGTLKARLVADNLLDFFTRVFIEPDGTWSIQPLKPWATEPRGGKMRVQLMVDIACALSRYNFNTLPPRGVDVKPGDFQNLDLWVGQKGVQVYSGGKLWSGREVDNRMLQCLGAMKKALLTADKEREAQLPLHVHVGKDGPTLSDDVRFEYFETGPQGLRGDSARDGFGGRLRYSHEVGRVPSIEEAKLRRLTQALSENDFKSLPKKPEYLRQPAPDKAYWVWLGKEAIEYAPEVVAARTARGNKKVEITGMPVDPDDPSKGIVPDEQFGFVPIMRDGSLGQPQGTAARLKTAVEQAGLARRCYAIVKVFVEVFGEALPPAPPALATSAPDPVPSKPQTPHTPPDTTVSVPTPPSAPPAGGGKLGVLVFKSTARVEGTITEMPDRYNVIKRNGETVSYPKYKIETVLWGPLSPNATSGSSRRGLYRVPTGPDGQPLTAPVGPRTTPSRSSSSDDTRRRADKLTAQPVAPGLPVPEVPETVVLKDGRSITGIVNRTNREDAYLVFQSETSVQIVPKADVQSILPAGPAHRADDASQPRK